jgi:hypothetical protein
MVKVTVYCEGPTEWYVIYQLVRRGIVVGEITDMDARDNIGRWIIKPDKITNKFLDGKPNFKRILFVFDQEDKVSPYDIKSTIESNCNSLCFTPSEYSNVFTGHYKDARVALFVSNASSPDGNKDFDGYIAQLIEKLGPEASKLWFEEARINNKNDDRLPAYLRNLRTQKNLNYDVIHFLGLNDIPNIMNEKNWGIQRSKTRLYAYITALQLNKSHVWFTEKLVKWAPKSALQEIFAPLIKAWEFLVEDSDEP